MQEPKIIYVDENIVVIYKPSGMTVNKADTTKNEETLQDWVNKNIILEKPLPIDKEKEQGQYSPEDEFIDRSGIVHRLDKETSGIILIAKNVNSFQLLQKQFKERLVKKSYLALVHGKVFPREGKISVPVGRLPFNRMRFGVVAGGREALTLYKVVKNYELKIKNKLEILSLLKLYPQTGRTHQIRVHLKYINKPIFSDSLYAGRKTSRDDRKILNRLFLHAEEITFTHPVLGKEMNFKGQMPEDLKLFLSELREINS